MVFPRGVAVNLHVGFGTWPQEASGRTLRDAPAAWWRRMHCVAARHGGLASFIARAVTWHWGGANRCGRGAGASPRAEFTTRLSVVHVIIVQVVHRERKVGMRNWVWARSRAVIPSLSLVSEIRKLPDAPGAPPQLNDSPEARAGTPTPRHAIAR